MTFALFASCIPFSFGVVALLLGVRNRYARALCWGCVALGVGLIWLAAEVPRQFGGTA